MEEKFFIFDESGNKTTLIVNSVEVPYVTPILTTNLGVLKLAFKMKKINDCFNELVILEKDNGEYFNITNHNRLIDFVCDNGGMKNTLLSRYYTGSKLN